MQKLVFFVVFVFVTLFPALALPAVNPFELPWMNSESKGATYKSGDHENAVFVVEAYFLGCHYCNDNAPNVNELAEKYSGQDRVQVLDIGIDQSDRDYATWIQRHQPNHPVLKDSRRTVIRQLGTTGYPSTYVLDCHGEIVYRSTGVWNSLSSVTAAVDAQLAKTCE